MKRLLPALFAAAAIAASLLASGCARKVLHVYIWPDYIAPEIVESFEKQHGCRVVFETFEENEEMMEKLVENPAAYDIITPSSYQVNAMRRNKLIARLDHSRLPNFVKNYDSACDVCLLDTGHEWSIPYAITFSGLAYRKDLPGDIPVDSWGVLSNPEFKDRTLILDDMRETIGAALLYLGHSLNSTNPPAIDEAIDIVGGWKQNGAKFDHEDYKNDLTSGRRVIAHAYSSDIFQLMQENADLAFALPKEGFSSACDELVVTSASRQPDLAYAFIDYLYDPEVCKANMEFVCALMPCSPAIEALDPGFREQLRPSSEVLAKGEVIRDFGDNFRIHDLYDLVWNRVLKVEE